MSITNNAQLSCQIGVEGIIAVLQKFSRHESQSASSTSQHEIFGEGLAAKIRNFITSNEPITMVLPAFPWKNPNTDKVLGSSPDLGEELGLARLNHLCEEIAKIYSCGAQLLLIADGPVYNDLLGIPDADFYDYGVKLRSMAQAKGFLHIKFKRLMDVLDIGESDQLSREVYLAAVDTCRVEMENRFLIPDFNLEEKIRNNQDTFLTFQKFMKSAREDVLWGPSIDPNLLCDLEEYATETVKIAKTMTKRLLAYENAIESRFTQLIRLSIHRSTGKIKISIPLIPQKDVFGLMPWHSCVVISAKGGYQTGFSKDFRATHNLIRKDGEPYFLREKHPLFDEWQAKVNIDHAYGGEVIVTNAGEGPQQLNESDRERLADLAILFRRRVQIRGFIL
jgi:pyoverdine/dityrosine biosynthesis protein Dit1